MPNNRSNYKTLKNTWCEKTRENFNLRYAVTGPIINPNDGVRAGIPPLGPISGPLAEPSPLNVKLNADSKKIYKIDIYLYHFYDINKMDTIKQLCHKLNEENLDGVKNLLTKESLSVRNTFALGAKYSPPSHQELAKIIQATQLKIYQEKE